MLDLLFGCCAVVAGVGILGLTIIHSRPSDRLRIEWDDPAA